MPANWYDRVKILITTSGSGETVNLGNAVSGFRNGTASGNNANIPDGTSLFYCIEENADWEIGRGTYNTTGPTFSRSAVVASSNGGSRISLSGNASIFFTVTAEALSKFAASFENDGLKILDTAANNTLQISPSENLTANRILSIDVDDSDRTLTISGSATISGTNTGDQTITLGNDLNGSGTGSITATIQSNVVDNTKLADMAGDRIKGRLSTTGDPQDLTPAQVTGILDNFVGDAGSGGTKGLVPAPAIGDSTKFLKGNGTWASPSTSVADGDYTDITVGTGGTVWTIDNNAVVEAKIANGAVSTNKIASSAVTDVKLANDAVTTAKILNSAVTTDKINNSAVTNAKLATDAVTTDKIADNAVGNSELAQMAANTIKGRSGTLGNPQDLTATQATDLLNAFVGDAGSGGTKGLVPAPASGDATKFLKGDGTWAAQSSGVADGDYTDITVSAGGTVWNIDAGAVGSDELATSAVIEAKIADGAVSLAKMANLARYSLIGRSSLGSGVPEVLTTSANVYTLLGSTTFANFRENLGATAVGSSIFTLTNPGAITFLRMNADNTVTARSAADFKTDLSLNNVENTALSGWAGSGNIATVGTITTGTWSGTVIGPTKGGTGFFTYATGDLLYSDATNSLAKLAGNTTTDRKFLSQVGTGTASAAPTWEQTIGVANGGTGANTFTVGKLLKGNGTSAVQVAADGEDFVKPGTVTVNGGILAAASTTSYPSLRVPPGTAPSSPASGDIWNNNGLLVYRDNASTTRTLVTVDGQQTLTNKTLTTPVIATISNTGTLTLPTSTDTLVGRDTTDTLTNKTIRTPASSETGTVTLTKTGSANKTIQLTGNPTIDNGQSWEAGDIILMYAGASSRTITQGTGITMRLAGTATTGSRTLAARGIATLFFVSATEVVVGGSGVT